MIAAASSRTLRLRKVRLPNVRLISGALDLRSREPTSSGQVAGETLFAQLEMQPVCKAYGAVRDRFPGDEIQRFSAFRDPAADQSAGSRFSIFNPALLKLPWIHRGTLALLRREHQFCEAGPAGGPAERDLQATTSEPHGHKFPTGLGI